MDPNILILGTVRMKRNEARFNYTVFIDRYIFVTLLRGIGWLEKNCLNESFQGYLLNSDFPLFSARKHMHRYSISQIMHIVITCTTVATKALSHDQRLAQAHVKTC